MINKTTEDFEKIVALKKTHKTNYNTKITELENKIPDISNLATKTALTALKNKMPDVSSLVKKKLDYNIRVAAIVTKTSNLDDKITKNKNKLEGTIMGTISLFLEIHCLTVKMVFKLM